jgi:hypothetical protein
VVYPNPAANSITIASENLRGTICELRIYNVVDNLVLEKSLVNNKTTIDISAFSSGMYFIRVENENGISMEMFIKE